MKYEWRDFDPNMPEWTGSDLYVDGYIRAYIQRLGAKRYRARMYYSNGFVHMLDSEYPSLQAAKDAVELHLALES